MRLADDSSHTRCSTTACKSFPHLWMSQPLFRTHHSTTKRSSDGTICLRPLLASGLVHCRLDRLFGCKIHTSVCPGFGFWLFRICRLFVWSIMQTRSTWFRWEARRSTWSLVWCWSASLDFCLGCFLALAWRRLVFSSRSDADCCTFHRRSRRIHCRRKYLMMVWCLAILSPGLRREFVAPK